MLKYFVTLKETKTLNIWMKSQRTLSIGIRKVFSIQYIEEQYSEVVKPK